MPKVLVLYGRMLIFLKYVSSDGCDLFITGTIWRHQLYLRLIMLRVKYSTITEIFNVVVDNLFHKVLFSPVCGRVITEQFNIIHENFSKLSSEIMSWDSSIHVYTQYL